jgi:hypothetical protein
MLALCLASAAHADAPAPVAPPAQSASPAPAPAPKPPASASARELLALLEFLGSFENADGDWVDPFILDDPVFEKTRSAEKAPRDE